MILLIPPPASISFLLQENNLLVHGSGHVKILKGVQCTHILGTAVCSLTMPVIIFRKK